MVEDSLGDEVGHYLSDGSVILAAAIENILDYFVELIHLKLFYSVSHNHKPPIKTRTQAYPLLLNLSISPQ